MNSCQKLLVSLLSAAIHQRKPEIIIDGNINLRTVFEEAVKHDVYTILYSVINDLKIISPEDELYIHWRKVALTAGMKQIQHVHDIQQAIDVLIGEGIPIIVLKGLVLRELYPQNEFRTMIDADILLKEENIERAIRALQTLGYYEEGREDKHVSLIHEMKHKVELHKELVSFKSNFAYNQLKKDLWERAQTHYLGCTKVLKLSDEDLLLHLILHMAEHIRNTGIGLRQLCDLTLLIDAKGEKLDWNYFNAYAGALGISRFTEVIFHICIKLLGMNLVFYPVKSISESDPYIDIFIDDIISGGVFGQYGTARHIANRLLQYSENSSMQSFFKKQHILFINYIIPPVKSFGPRYSYVKRCFLLYPIAWLHRFFYSIFFSDFKGITNTIYKDTPLTMNVYYERIKLLEWLGLK